MGVTNDRILRALDRCLAETFVEASEKVSSPLRKHVKCEFRQATTRLSFTVCNDNPDPRPRLQPRGPTSRVWVVLDTQISEDFHLSSSITSGFYVEYDGCKQSIEQEST